MKLNFYPRPFGPPRKKTLRAPGGQGGLARRVIAAPAEGRPYFPKTCFEAYTLARETAFR